VSALPPVNGDVARMARIEDRTRETLLAQGMTVREVRAAIVPIRDDARGRLYLDNRIRSGRGEVPESLLLVSVQQEGEAFWRTVRLPLPRDSQTDPRPLIAQAVLIYIVLVGGLWLLLRRITRPLDRLTRRSTEFAANPARADMLEPSGPEDMRRLIEAHNAMEARIATLLDEKDVMLGAIGHDLKTPLAALRIRIESVEDDRARARMAATVEDITAMLDDILSLARAGRNAQNRQMTDLGALVADVVAEFEDLDRPVMLEEAARIALPLAATPVRRAIRNLVENALRYGQRARLRVTRDDAGNAVVSVMDDGPGIPDADIGRMLEPFARGDPSRNRNTGGAGLGLTLARAIAQGNGGRLELANRVVDGKIAGLHARLVLPIDSPR
jgi:signal transduction histidine kinase